MSYRKLTKHEEEYIWLLYKFNDHSVEEISSLQHLSEHNILKTLEKFKDVSDDEFLEGRR